MFDYRYRAEIFPVNDRSCAMVIETTNFKQLYRMAKLEARDFPFPTATPVCVCYYKDGIQLYEALYEENAGFSICRLSDGKVIAW